MNVNELFHDTVGLVGGERCDSVRYITRLAWSPVSAYDKMTNVDFPLSLPQLFPLSLIYSLQRLILCPLRDLSKVALTVWFDFRIFSSQAILHFRNSQFYHFSTDHVFHARWANKNLHTIYLYITITQH